MRSNDRARVEETAAAFEAALATRPRSQIAALGDAYRRFLGLEYRTWAPLAQAMGSVAGARAAWALVHGLITLEINGRFPADAGIDTAWEAGITAMKRIRRTLT